MSDNFPLKRYHKTFDHVSHFLFVPLPVSHFLFFENWAQLPSSKSKSSSEWIAEVVENKLLLHIPSRLGMYVQCNPCLWISKGPRRDLRSFASEADVCVFAVSIPNVGGSCVCCVSICIVLLFPGDTTCNHHHQLLPTALSPRSHNRHTRLWHT